MVEIHKEECMLLLQLPKCQLLAHTYTKDKKMYLLPVLGIYIFFYNNSSGSSSSNSSK